MIATTTVKLTTMYLYIISGLDGPALQEKANYKLFKLIYATYVPYIIIAL